MVLPNVTATQNPTAGRPSMGGDYDTGYADLIYMPFTEEEQMDNCDYAISPLLSQCNDLRIQTLTAQC